MYRIAKRFEFCAAHRLLNMPDGHKCSRLHGHNFSVEVVVESESLDHRGFADVDYGQFADFKRALELWDHRTILWSIDPLALDIYEQDEACLIEMECNPTAENIAAHFYVIARGTIPGRVVSVRVAETPGTWAEYVGPTAADRDPDPFADTTKYVDSPS
jgi:6-pyruvoyltetrahydropterin/6-carboxytetrahydropterin synthase